MKKFEHFNAVIPAQTGNQRFYPICLEVLYPRCGCFFPDWIPACAGMTNPFELC